MALINPTGLALLVAEAPSILRSPSSLQLALPGTLSTHAHSGTVGRCIPVIPAIAGARSAPLPWSCSTSSVVVTKLDTLCVKFNLACSEFCKCMQANCQNPMKAAASDLDGDNSDDEEFDEEFEELA